jgi:hypothetical protein
MPRRSPAASRSSIWTVCHVRPAQRRQTPFSATSLFQCHVTLSVPRHSSNPFNDAGRLGWPLARARQRRADGSMRGCADSRRKQPRPGRGCTVRVASPVAIEEERHPAEAARREHRRDLARQAPASAYAAPPASPRMRLGDPPPAWHSLQRRAGAPCGRGRTHVRAVQEHGNGSKGRAEHEAADLDVTAASPQRPAQRAAAGGVARQQHSSPQRGRRGGGAAGGATLARSSIIAAVVPWAGDAISSATCVARFTRGVRPALHPGAVRQKRRGSWGLADLVSVQGPGCALLLRLTRRRSGRGLGGGAGRAPRGCKRLELAQHRVVVHSVRPKHREL